MQTEDARELIDIPIYIKNQGKHTYVTINTWFYIGSFKCKTTQICSIKKRINHISEAIIIT
jgi:subtilase family serine protease